FLKTSDERLWLGIDFMRRLLTFCLPVTVLGMFAMGLASSRNQNAADSAPQTARGLVFHDSNGNRRFDEGEKPLKGIRVSNGRDIVKTDDEGRYELPVDDDTIVFVIKPRGWRTPL